MSFRVNYCYNIAIVSGVGEGGWQWAVDKGDTNWNTKSTIDDSVLPPRKTANDPSAGKQFQAKADKEMLERRLQEALGVGGCEKMREIYKEAGGSLPYEAVGVLGAGAATGALAMAAVADVRPETSTVTLLCTHRLCHCERGKRERGLWGSDAHQDRQQCPYGRSRQQSRLLAVQRWWVEGQRWTWTTVTSLTKPSGEAFSLSNSSIFCPPESSQVPSEASQWPPSRPNWPSNTPPADRNTPVLHIRVSAITASVRWMFPPHSPKSCFSLQSDQSKWSKIQKIHFKTDIHVWKRSRSSSRSRSLSKLCLVVKARLKRTYSQLSELPGTFFVFSVAVNDNIWLNLQH